jgi:hypothetical protein
MTLVSSLRKNMAQGSERAPVMKRRESKWGDRSIVSVGYRGVLNTLRDRRWGEIDFVSPQSESDRSKLDDRLKPFVAKEVGKQSKKRSDCDGNRAIILAIEGQ